MTFHPGLDITINASPLGFKYGPGTFGPAPEFRSLDSIRASLRNPDCDGPDPVYAIAMDVGKREHRAELDERMLLFGLVTYAAGRLDREPIRSQGHVHKVSSHSGWSPPEVYEIWSGSAFIYIQEFAADDPGRCFAVAAGPGDIVVVPPGWAHATISANPEEPLTFGALCDREYGFLYDEVRKRRGLAWYPVLDGSRVVWERNPAYGSCVRDVDVRPPGDYSRLGISRSRPLYAQAEQGFSRFQWVSKPGLVKDLWNEFTP